MQTARKAAQAELAWAESTRRNALRARITANAGTDKGAAMAFDRTVRAHQLYRQAECDLRRRLARNTPDADLGKGRNCAEFAPPAARLGPHVAALGMRFYQGNMFPAEYRGNIFIAEHGSWNRRDRIGYRIKRVVLAQGRVARQEVFAEGWLGNGEAWGRPVDVEVMRDGSLLVSDDQAGVIYRISYRAP
mgnify:CR=1 FL=1